MDDAVLIDKPKKCAIIARQKRYFQMLIAECFERMNMKFLDIECSRNEPTSTISTIYSHLMRVCWTRNSEILKLKKKNTDFNIKWEIIKNVKPYAPGDKICKLCLQEKLSILISKPSLNKRTDIFGHCVHRKQFLLNNIKEQYTPPASQQQQRKYSINQQLSRLKKEPKGASKLLSHDNDDI